VSAEGSSREPASSSAAPLTGGGLQERLRYQFKDRALLELALTHASLREEGRQTNERLEFLGDAVLGLVIAHFLYTAFPELSEGRLTRLRSAVVSAEPLARLGRRLELDQAVRLGKGLRRDELSPAVLANVVEAVIGAVFLDGGIEAASPLILWGLEPEIDDELAQRSARNWKSRLQEHTQHLAHVTPTYAVREEEGPDHRKEFVVAALINGVERGRGRGASKKAAEQAAAREALERLLGDEAARGEGTRGL